MLEKRIVLLFWVCLIGQLLIAQDLYRVQENGRFGYIDKKGKKVIPCIYVNAGEFRDGLTPVRLPKGLFGYINTKGTWAIKPQYDYAREFSEGLAVVFELGEPKLINLKNTIVFDYDTFKKSKKCTRLTNIKKTQDNNYQVFYSSESRFWNMYAIIDTTFKILKNEPASYEDFSSNIRNKQDFYHTSSLDSIDTVDKCFGNISFLYKSEFKFQKINKKIPFLKDSVYIFVDTRQIDTSLQDKQLCYRAYLINTKKDSIRIYSGLDFELEALDKNSTWVKLFSKPNSRCFMGNDMVSYYKNRAYGIEVPIFKGAYKTKLRVRLPKHSSHNEYEIISNEFEATINYGQF